MIQTQTEADWCWWCLKKKWIGNTASVSKIHERAIFYICSVLELCRQGLASVDECVTTAEEHVCAPDVFTSAEMRGGRGFRVTRRVALHSLEKASRRKPVNLKCTGPKQTSTDNSVHRNPCKQNQNQHTLTQTSGWDETQIICSNGNQACTSSLSRCVCVVVVGGGEGRGSVSVWLPLPPLVF